MTKLMTRLVFGLWIVGAPLLLAGCGDEGSKPATPATPAAGADAKPTAPAAVPDAKTK